MRYGKTLRDLCFYPSTIGLIMRLHDCREIKLQILMREELGFAKFIGAGKMVGSSVVSMMPPKVTPEAIFRDLDARQLDPADPMYPVATDYDTHQHMREYVRQTLMQTQKRPKKERVHVDEAMAALSVWLILHDPQEEFANDIRLKTYNSLKDFRRAIFSVACSKRLAYVRHIGPDPINLNRALRDADHSTQSGFYPVEDKDYEDDEGPLM